MSVKPISPSEVISNKQLPDEVIEAFNDLITIKFDGVSASFTQDEIVGFIQDKVHCTSEFVFQQKFLDVESIYRKHGWDVKYDKSCAGEEPYPARFTFSKSKNNPNTD